MGWDSIQGSGRTNSKKRFPSGAMEAQSVTLRVNLQLTLRRTPLNTRSDSGKKDHTRDKGNKLKVTLHREKFKFRGPENDSLLLDLHRRAMPSCHIYS